MHVGKPAKQSSSTSTPKSNQVLVGFLTALDFEQCWVGGYLVLNATGRPVEFHCTAPVKPTRAQEILYGPTLMPFLLGEQIGGTLLDKARTKPAVVWTNHDAMLAVRPSQEMPVACLVPTAGQHTFEFHGHHALASSHFEGDQSVVRQLEPSLRELTDLAEPFSRIEEAIREAQSTRKSA